MIDKEDNDLAIKVYMTSIMPFKSRDKYVKGDFRMRHGYSKATSWKLVSKWTEKEYRNLIRIKQSGLIPCPTPLRLKGVVLLMSFIGKNGVPAPKLKDACFIPPDDDHPPLDWLRLYTQVVNDVRTLYQKCRLIHADLSEYNLLYMDEKVWMIDVSQVCKFFVLHYDFSKVNIFDSAHSVNLQLLLINCSTVRLAHSHGKVVISSGSPRLRIVVLAPTGSTWNSNREACLTKNKITYQTRGMLMSDCAYSGAFGD